MSDMSAVKALKDEATSKIDTRKNEFIEMKKKIAEINQQELELKEAMEQMSS